MSFNPNIPQGTQALSQSSAPIQTNFSQSNSIFSVDHVTFNSTDVGNRGKHYKVTYPEWVKPPQATVDPATAPNEIAFYSKDVGGVTRGFMRQENNGTVIQTTGPDPLIGKPGSTFLPGGLIMQWDQKTAVASGTNVNFPTAFPNNCFYVGITTVDGANPTISDLFVYLDPTLNKAFFKVYCSRRLSQAAINGNFTYLAIGN